MQRKNLTAKAVLAIMVCLAICLSGCALNADSINPDGSDATPLPSTSSSSTTPSNDEPPQSDPHSKSEYIPATDIGIDLDDGTEIRVIVSGIELDFTGRNQPVKKGNEVFSDEYDYIFANLKGADGVENAGFGAMVSVDTGGTTYKALVGNSEFELVFVEGEETFTRNGEIIPLDAPAQRIDGIFMIPVLAAASAVGVLPVLDEQEQTLSISY